MLQLDALDAFDVLHCVALPKTYTHNYLVFHIIQLFSMLLAGVGGCNNKMAV